MDEGPLLNLLWNNHNSTIISGFQQLHRKEIFCDATIVCDGKYFPVHRLILSSCSEYFEEIFRQTPCKHPFVVLKDVSSQVFEALVNFMYSGEVNILEEIFEAFIETGKLLKIKELSVTDDKTGQVSKPSCFDREQSNKKNFPLFNESMNIQFHSEGHSSSKDRPSYLKKYGSFEKRKGLCSPFEHHAPKRVRGTVAEQEETPHQSICDSPVKRTRTPGKYEKKKNSCESIPQVSDIKSDLVKIEMVTETASNENKKKLSKSSQCYDKDSYKEITELKKEAIKTEECGSSSKYGCKGESLTKLDVVVKKEETCDGSFTECDSDAYGADPLEEEYTSENQYYPEDWCQSGSDQEYAEGTDFKYEDSDSETEGVVGTRARQFYSCASSITVRCSSNTPDKRIWNKRQYCAFCSKSFTNITKHLLNHHSKEKEVVEILCLPLNSQERKLQLERVRNIGNYNHNCSVLQSECGEIIPWRCPPLAVNYQDYLPCQYCYGFFYIKELSKHNKNCKFRQECDQENGQAEPKSRKLISESRLLLPAKKNNKLGLQEKVFSQMHGDTVTMVAKDDPLITEFGVKKFEKVGHLPQHHVPISQKIRELARFVMAAKSIDPEIDTLRDIIDPAKFNVVSEAVRKVAGYREKENCYETPSVVSKIGHALYQCAYILKRSSVFERDFFCEKRCDAFLDLYREELRSKCFLP